LEESLRLFQEQGDVLHASMVLSALEVIVSSQGDEEMARSLYQQSLSLIQQAHDRGTLGLFLINMGDVFHQYGEEQMAQASYRQGLRLWQEMHQVEQQLGIVKGLAGLAEGAAAQGQAERAGRLFGAASRLLPATSTTREEVNRRSAVARAHLDAATFEAGWAAGQTMTEEQAVTLALQDA
jgi:tetratricopeptide (TPR) repeat protein